VWRPQLIARPLVAVGLRISPEECTREMSAALPECFRAGRQRLTTNVTLLNADGLPVRDRDAWPVDVEISQAFKVRRRLEAFAEGLGWLYEPRAPKKTSPDLKRADRQNMNAGQADRSFFSAGRSR
jgi:hypothetical protein